VKDYPDLDPGGLYDLLHKDLENLKEETLHCLRESSGLREIKIHSIAGRVKERDSFLEKIERKKYRDPVNDTEDLVGLRVVCLFTDDLSRIGEIIHEEFAVLDVEDKVASADVASFGYMSQHYVCRLRSEFHGRRYDRIKGQKFEIQCRTLLMDAWANVSHHLAYKGESSIPQDLRKDFHALSGLLYVADRQFQSLLSAARKSQDEAVEIVADALGDGLDRPLDLSAMQAYLASTFPGREKAGATSESELVEELAAAGIGTVRRLQEKVQLGIAARGEEQGSIGGRYNQVGLVRWAVRCADERYSEYYRPTYNIE
jgi:putative GTP pyrophosphokinase